MLSDVDKKASFFKDLAKINDGEHKYFKKVKSKINKILEQELEYLGFSE